MSTLEIRNLCGSVTLASNRIPRHWDYCWEFSYEFHSGMVYGILGTYGSGGESITTTLSGNPFSADLRLEEGEIYYNGKIVNDKALKNLTCVLGYPPTDSKRYKGKTLEYILKRAIKKNKVNKHSFDEIIDKFLIARSRLDRKMNQLGNSVWESTAAIGYAQGKRIFIFPFINPAELDYFIYRIKGICEILKNENCIVIINTNVVDCIHYLVDEVINIKGRFQTYLDAIKQYQLDQVSLERISKLFSTTEAETLELINKYQEFIGK